MTLDCWKTRVQAENLEDLVESDLQVSEQDINEFLSNNLEAEEYPDSIEEVDSVKMFKLVAELVLDEKEQRFVLHDSGENLGNKLTVMEM